MLRVAPRELAGPLATLKQGTRYRLRRTITTPERQQFLDGDLHHHDLITAM